MEATYLDLGDNHANDIAVLQQSIALNLNNATTSIQFNLTASIENQDIRIAYLGTEWDSNIFVIDPEGAGDSASDTDSSAPGFATVSSSLLIFLVSLCVLILSEN